MKQHVEMERLRNYALVKKKYPFMERYYESPLLGVMFANIACLSQEKVQNIQSDFGYMGSDIIMLSECHLNISLISELELKNYRIVKATGKSGAFSTHDQICYIRRFHERIRGTLSFLAHNAAMSDRYTTEQCEMSIKTVFNEILNRSNIDISKSSVLMVGDFNIDFNLQETSEMLDYFNTRYGLRPTLTRTGTR